MIVRLSICIRNNNEIFKTVLVFSVSKRSNIYFRYRGPQLEDNETLQMKLSVCEGGHQLMAVSWIFPNYHSHVYVCHAFIFNSAYKRIHTYKIVCAFIH